MIDFVLASTVMLADLSSWITAALLTWLIVAIAVAIPLGRMLHRASPDRDDEDPS